MTVFIPAAGLGTRLRPLTDHLPKALVPVHGKPMLQHLLEKCRRAGLTRVVVNVHHFASQITDFLAAHGNFGLELYISDETDLLRDTGGALRHAAPLLGEGPVLVHNVDVFTHADFGCLGRAYEGLCARDPRAAALLWVGDRPTSRYLLWDAEDRLQGWTHKGTGAVKRCGGAPAGQLPLGLRPLAFSGLHILGPEAMAALQAEEAEVFSLIDFYLRLGARRPVYGQLLPGDLWYDAGKAPVFPRGLAQLP